MKHLKMFALAAVAAGALMAFIGAGTASATVLCSTTVEVCPTAQKWGNIALDFSVPAGGSASLTQTNGEPIITCRESTIKGKITNTGSSTETVTALVEELLWGGCNLPVKTLKVAPLEVHRISGTSSGTVTAEGTFEVTVNTIFFGSCIFKAVAGADFGVLIEGKPGVFEANLVLTSSNSPPCPTTAILSAQYRVTTPENTTLSVEPSTD